MAKKDKYTINEKTVEEHTFFDNCLAGLYQRQYDNKIVYTINFTGKRPMKLYENYEEYTDLDSFQLRSKTIIKYFIK